MNLLVHFLSIALFSVNDTITNVISEVKNQGIFLTPILL